MGYFFKEIQPVTHIIQPVTHVIHYYCHLTT